MPRGQISQPDRELIDQLAQRDLSVTRYQLERWRSKGLLPRVCEADEMLDVAQILAETSTRGRDWQACVFEVVQSGYLPSEAAMREAAVWLVANRRQGRAKVLAIIANRPELADADPLDQVEGLLSMIASKRERRYIRHTIKEKIRSRYPHMNQRQLKERTDTAEVWHMYYTLWPDVDEDPEFLALADGFANLEEATQYGWEPSFHIDLDDVAEIADCLTYAEMDALMTVYGMLIQEPGSEFLLNGAAVFEHLLMDVVLFRRNHADSLKTPVSRAVIFDHFGFGE